ncbi:MAG: CBS domain-containing protein [Actinomycetota bacterium]
MHSRQLQQEPVGQNSESLTRVLGTVGEAMTASVVTVEASTDCQTTARDLERRGVSGAPVIRDGRVVGVITLRDLAARAGIAPALASGPFLRFEGRLRDVTVDEVMSRPPMLVSSDWPLVRAVEVMERSGVNRLSVVDDTGRPVGILARDDVIRAMARRYRGQEEETPRPRMGPD